MACIDTSTKRVLGATLVEFLIALAVSGVLLGTIAQIWMYSARAFAVTGNYADLDARGRIAMDIMSRDIRRADKLLFYDTNIITFQMDRTNQVSFRYESNKRELVREIGKNKFDQVLLKDCDFLRFDIFQNAGTNLVFELLAPATTNNCKVVQVTWLASRSVVGLRNTQGFRSARIVMRKRMQ